MYRVKKSWMANGKAMPQATRNRKFGSRRKQLEKMQQSFGILSTPSVHLNLDLDHADQYETVENFVEGFDETSQQNVAASFPMLSSGSDDTDAFLQRPVQRRRKPRKKKGRKPFPFLLDEVSSPSPPPSPSQVSSPSPPLSPFQVSPPSQPPSPFQLSSPSPPPLSSEPGTPIHSSGGDSPMQESEQGASEYEVVEEENPRKELRKQNSQILGPSSTTTDEVTFIALTLGLRHSISWEGQVDLLRMFRVMYDKSKIPKSKNTYLKNLYEKESLSYQVFCNDCHLYVGKAEEKDKFFTCSVCSKSLPVDCPSNSFVSLSIKPQLEQFLQDEVFVNHILNYRFNRKTREGEMSDIYDGKVYRKLSENGGILSAPLNFSLSFFTDGVKLWQSSKSIWPIYLTCNELPYEERSKYIILAGIYVNSKEPDQCYFLKPFVEEMNFLSSVGIDWVLEGKPVNSKVVPLAFIADSVARAAMLNMQAHNAYYGCTFCYRKGEVTGSRAKFTVGEPSELRTDDSWKDDLCEVYNRRNNPDPKDRVFRGVKGTCTLLSLNYFSIENVIVDYMHATLLGAVKTHTEFLTASVGSDHANQVWEGLDNIRMGKDHVIKTLDKRIEAIKFNTASRKKLPLLSKIKSWKASEYRSWLLFYAIPCLSGLLKDKYLAHFALLSTAMHLLLQQKVSMKDVEEAHRLLIMYHFYFQKYFGKQNMHYNIHLLTHVCHVVLNFGPLWLLNSFLYESYNSNLLSLVKSPHKVAHQICKKFRIFQLLPSLASQMVSSDSILKFCQSIVHFKRLSSAHRSNANECVFFGSPQCYEPTSHESLQMSRSIGIESVEKCFIYGRMSYKRLRYTTDSYKSETGKRLNTNDSYAFVDNKECVLIKQIVNISSVNRVILYVQKVKLSKHPVVYFNYNHNQFIFKKESRDEYEFIAVNRLDSPAFLARPVILRSNNGRTGPIV